MFSDVDFCSVWHLNLAPKTNQNHSNIYAKRPKNRSKETSKKWCILGSIFGGILMDFRKENGSKLAPRSHQKSTLIWKRKNQLNASPLAFSWLSGVEVEGKNEPKIDKKWSRDGKGRPSKLISIFLSDFGANLVPIWTQNSINILPKLDPKRHQKNDWIFEQFL